MSDLSGSTKRRRSLARESAKDVRPEPQTVAGEILLSHNHISLLQGLFNRPQGTSTSCADLVRAGMPYLTRLKPYASHWGLRRSVATLHPAWADRVCEGSRTVITLTERGRAIVDRQVPTRIRGWGPYHGFATLAGETTKKSSSDIPADTLRDVANYTRTFGIPLHVGPAVPHKPALCAVSSGVDRAFQFVSDEELRGRGPRGLHFHWTRECIDAWRVPGGYADAFSEYGVDDILQYLREIRRRGSDEAELYCRVYGNRTFLSDTKRNAWLSEEIDLTESEIPPKELQMILRKTSEGYQRAVKAMGGYTKLNWKHPDTGRSLGSVFNTKTLDVESDALMATSPSAVSCFELHCAEIGAGIRIVTRYVR